MILYVLNNCNFYFMYLNKPEKNFIQLKKIQTRMREFCFRTTCNKPNFTMTNKPKIDFLVFPIGRYL